MLTSNYTFLYLKNYLYSKPVKGLLGCGVGYCFSFNGKELDKGDEGMGGGGSTYDYGFRIYNAQLGKFLSVDPFTKYYPWYTPYQYAGNKPIVFIDRDGLEEARPDEITAAIMHPFDAKTVKSNSTVAFAAANNSGLPDPRDGKQDAFRHAYWNALNARDLGETKSAFFPTLHETGSEANDPSSPEYDPVAVRMDLYNNFRGREIGAAHPEATDEELATLVLAALNDGKLLVVKIGEVKDENGDTQRVPVNKNKEPISNNLEKVLTGSAPFKPATSTPPPASSTPASSAPASFPTSIPANPAPPTNITPPKI